MLVGHRHCRRCGSHRCYRHTGRSIPAADHCSARLGSGPEEVRCARHPEPHSSRRRRSGPPRRLTRSQLAVPLANHGQLWQASFGTNPSLPSSYIPFCIVALNRGQYRSSNLEAQWLKMRSGRCAHIAEACHAVRTAAWTLRLHQFSAQPTVSFVSARPRSAHGTKARKITGSGRAMRCDAMRCAILPSTHGAQTACINDRRDR